MGKKAAVEFSANCIHQRLFNTSSMYPNKAVVRL